MCGSLVDFPQERKWRINLWDVSHELTFLDKKESFIKMEVSPFENCCNQKREGKLAQ